MSGDLLTLGAVALLALAVRRGSGAKFRMAYTPVMDDVPHGLPAWMLAVVYESVGGLHRQYDLGHYTHTEVWKKVQELNEALGINDDERARMVRMAVEAMQPTPDERVKQIQRRAIDAWTQVIYQAENDKFDIPAAVVLEVAVLLDEEDGEVLSMPIESIEIGTKTRAEAQAILEHLGRSVDAMPLDVKIEWLLAAEDE